MAKAFDDESGNTIIVSVKKVGDKKQSFAYDENAASSLIINDSTSSTGLDLEPEYLETVVEQVDRSKWLGTGIKLSIKFLKGEIEIEKKPTR